MTTIIISALVLIALFLGFKFFTGKGKTQTQKSPSEKIAESINSSIKSNLKDLEKGIRTPERIKKELVERFDDAFIKMKKNFEAYVTELIRTRRENEAIIESTQKSIDDLTEKAKQYKAQYMVSGNDKDKAYAEKFIGIIIKNEEQLKVSKSIVENYKDKIEDATINFDIMKSELVIKRSKVISMVNDPQTTFELINVDLDELTLEFKQRVEERDTMLEVKKTVAKSDSNTSSIIVSDKDIKDRFDAI